MRMFDWIRLPASRPKERESVEASVFSRAGPDARLPSEAEFQRAAFGTFDCTERTHPWGEAELSVAYGVFDFSSWDPSWPARTPQVEAHGALKISLPTAGVDANAIRTIPGFEAMPSQFNTS